MVQSSTDPCLVVMAGGLSGRNTVGVAPSAVMKKFVGPSGLSGSASTSEKYRLRRVVGLIVRSPAKRGRPGVPEMWATVNGGAGACGLVSIMASGGVGWLSPSGPVAILRV